VVTWAFRQQSFRTSILVGIFDPVRAGGWSDDEHARLGIAEVGDGLAPVLSVTVGAALLARDLFAVGDEARAAGAGHDFVVQDGEPMRRVSVHSFNGPLLASVVCGDAGSNSGFGRSEIRGAPSNR
jgi:hypothetical protein